MSGTRHSRPCTCRRFHRKTRLYRFTSLSFRDGTRGIELSTVRVEQPDAAQDDPGIARRRARTRLEGQAPDACRGLVERDERIGRHGREPRDELEYPPPRTQPEASRSARVRAVPRIRRLSVAADATPLDLDQLRHVRRAGVPGVSLDESEALRLRELDVDRDPFTWADGVRVPGGVRAERGLDRADDLVRAEHVLERAAECAAEPGRCGRLSRREELDLFPSER